MLLQAGTPPRGPPYRGRRAGRGAGSRVRVYVCESDERGTTPRERAIRIAEQTTGFIYYVSITGITGERTELPQSVVDNVAWLKEQTPLPICIGFGISRPDHVEMLKPVALGDDIGEISPDEDPRLRLGNWMSSKDNPFFAKALVNRYWKHFLSGL